MTNISAVLGQSDQLFGKRGSLMSLWQEIAELCYPERADFTTCRSLGEELARNLMTGFPVLARRELGNSFGGMLRPNNKPWFHITTANPEKLDTEGKRYLQFVADFMRRAMYDRRAHLTRATKEADHDFATFGQCVISAELRRERDGLLFRCWHLRDVAWCENDEGEVDTVHRRWKPTASMLDRLFGARIHEKVREALQKDPYAEFDVRHVVMPVADYRRLGGALSLRTPLVSLYIDVANRHVMEEVGLYEMPYIIPRWQTVSGSQYASSPATVVALADARLIQDETRVLLEAGEKAVNPPMLGVQEAIRSDVAIYAGGITWVDSEYDERLGEVLRPMTLDKSGLGFGMEMVRDTRQQISDAFMISKMNLPPAYGTEMTAYEVAQRVQEYIRNTLPLFEPMEMEYNGRLCETVFSILMRNVPELRASIPPSLQGVDVQFVFESPLRDAQEKVKVGQFMEAQAVLAAAAQIDNTAPLMVDTRKATREVLEAVAPAQWLRGEIETDELVRATVEAQQQQQMAEQMQQVVKTMADARQAVPQGAL